LTPEVSLIICAYNEERSIGKTLENVLDTDYPADRLQILVASDGSTDRTDQIVTGFASRGVELVACPRSGKENARAAAVDRSRGEILLFSDANNLWNRGAVRNLVRNFADPRVGCVSGKTVYVDDPDNVIASRSGAYWKYEDFTKRQEGALGRLVAVDGPIFAVRRQVFEPVPVEAAADMVVPLRTQERGYLAVYEPEAIGIEEPRREAGEEIRSRVRIVVRGFSNLRVVSRLLNPFCRPQITFFLVSHKLLRWLAPVFLVSFFLLNVFLVPGPVYSVFFGLQVMFYGSALVGLGLAGRRKNIFSTPYYFCLINYCALVGLFRFLFGGRTPTWEPGR
jgi:cellulose synthase/poly-beta-1,6-N-acetylglucosamine synthase-like glycosyltransferase